MHFENIYSGFIHPEFNALCKIISKCVSTHFPQRIRILKIIGSAFLFFIFFIFCLSGFWASLSPSPLSKTMLRSSCFWPLNTFKLKLYSESDTVHKILHKVWASFALKDMIFNARQGFCMRNWNILHHSKQSLYFINSTPLSITNNLHCPSIKRATSISYLYRSPPVHNTACTKISFWTSSYRIAQYMDLTLHLFYI